MTDPNEFSDRYVALWNESDADRRREIVKSLWTEDALHILQPPGAVVESATGLGFTPAVALEARGHAEIEHRAKTAYERFVATGEMTFRRREPAVALKDTLKFRWEAVRSADGEVIAVGLDFLIFDADDRIRLDYQFIES